jgi:hypothetical protein
MDLVTLARAPAERDAGKDEVAVKDALADLQRPLQIQCRGVLIFVWDTLHE